MIRTVRYGTTRIMLTTPDPIGTSVELSPHPQPQPSPREQEVLSAVLDLMVEEGDGFSMSKVCRRASCSKETLYNWFGDRDGLLTATVQWQASKVRLPAISPSELSAQKFADGLTGFAINWLQVITGDVSAALNRLAISHAGSSKSQLGKIVLQNGPMAISKRLQPMFLAGHRAGYVTISDMDAALRCFFGLVVADWQIRKLLGEKTTPTANGIQQTAKEAVAQFLALYRPENTNSISNTNTVKTGE